MDGRDAFEPEEWQAVCRLPLLTAALISAVDYSSISEEREYRAFSAFIQRAGEKRKRAGIVADILNDTDFGEREVFLELCLSVTGALSGDNPIEKAINDAKTTGKLVDTKLSKKAAKSYKEFVLDVALAVARAHKESMMPFAGPVSRVEDFHIRRLAQALGV